MYTAPHGDGNTLAPLSGPVLLAYARYLGLDPETEPELLHIAREALTDSLPLGWERHLDATHNMPFFYCHNGGYTSWQHPQLSHYLTKIDMLRRPAARPQDVQALRALRRGAPLHARRAAPYPPQ